MKKLIFSLFFLIASTPALANVDSGLYDPLPPEGSAFIRFLSERNTSGSLEAKANSKGYDYLSYKDITSYYVVPQGPVQTSIGDAKADFEAKAGEFYTIVLNETPTLDVKTDPPNKNQAKSQIIFYNLSSDSNLSLKTSDGKVEIVPPLASNATGEKQINPVKVSLAIYKDGQVVKDLGPVSLERAKSYTAVAMDNNEVKWIPSSTNTTR